MSLFSNIPQELKKVLLKIFDYLNEEDLRRCETVCRQWRQVLLSGEPWQRLFQRKIISSQQWRQVGRNFVPDEKKLQTEHYRSICMASIHELKQIYQNFRTGNYMETSEKVDSFHNSDVIIGCD